jgi:anti-sigma regulatory factor (Ser/Thr protein kinase)
VRDARQGILDYAKLCGFSAHDLIDVALGAGEALANAVEHGTRDLGFFTVSCDFEDGALTIEVADAGLGFDTSTIATKRRDPNAIRGFGISIMHSVMDEVVYLDRGTTVRLRKRRAAVATDASDVNREDRA